MGRQASEKVQAIRVEQKDDDGNLVKAVLAKGDEYVIYEIDIPDVGSALRVLIDGVTEERDRQIMERYLRVKPRYMEAKALLYKSEFNGAIKNRIVSTLASVLYSDKLDGVRVFDDLIRCIKKDRYRFMVRHLLHISPCLMAVVASAVVLWLYQDGLPTGTVSRPAFLVVLAASVGGGLSVLTNAKNNRFDEMGAGWYLLLGVERLLVSCFAASIAYVLMKSGIVLGGDAKASNWNVLLLLIVAAFSEVLVPSILQNLEKKAGDSGSAAKPAAAPGK